MKGDDWNDRLSIAQRKAIDNALRVRRKRMGFFRRMSVDYPWAVLFFGLLAIATAFSAVVRYELVETVLTWVES